MTKFLRFCHTVHSWTGVILLPWVIIIGATGFYLNHRDMVLSWIGQVDFSEAGFDSEEPQKIRDESLARQLGKTIWPEQPIKRIDLKDYHGRPSFYVRKKSGTVILSILTGHYYIKTRYTRQTFAPDGKLLHTKRY